jgi:hypothetical protein
MGLGFKLRVRFQVKGWRRQDKQPTQAANTSRQQSKTIPAYNKARPTQADNKARQDKRQPRQDQPWLCRQANAEKREKTDNESV